MNLLMRLPLLWKVLAAPVIAAVFFVVYLAFTTFVFNQNNERLVGIRDRDFPALEVATENVANLDKIVEGLNSAVSSGEKDLLETTDGFAKKARDGYSRLRDIDSSRATEVDKLRSEFDAYYSAARGLSEKMMDKNAAPDPSAIGAMSTALENYRKDLNAFREAAHKRFVETVDQTKHDSDRATWVGLAIAIVSFGLSLAFGLLVAVSIKRNVDSVVTSLRDIAEGEGDLLTCLALFGPVET